MRTHPWSLALGLGLATHGAAAQMPDSADPPAPAREPDRVFAGTEADDAAPSSELDAQLVGGIASLGVGLGFVVAFNYAFFRVNDLLNDEGFLLYRKGIRKDQSSCEMARQGVASTRADAPPPSEMASLCDELDSTLVLRNVALPIGLAASVIGTVLIGTSDTVVGPEQARNWNVRVGVASGAGSLTIEGRF